MSSDPQLFTIQEVQCSHIHQEGLLKFNQPITIHHTMARLLAPQTGIYCMYLTHEQSQERSYQRPAPDDNDTIFQELKDYILNGGILTWDKIHVFDMYIKGYSQHLHVDAPLYCLTPMTDQYNIADIEHPFIVGYTADQKQPHDDELRLNKLYMQGIHITDKIVVWGRRFQVAPLKPHEGIVEYRTFNHNCDGCHTLISDEFVKCKVCPDYDLCTSCLQHESGGHVAAHEVYQMRSH